MDLIWSGRNITSRVNITGCVHRESAYGRLGSLDLTLDHASQWYKWQPEEDEEIIVIQDDYSTGRMYFNAVIPDGDQYRIIATSAKRAAGRKAWDSWKDTTLQNLMDESAAECGLESRLYGVDGNIPYSYLLRRDEGPLAFAARIGRWEGMHVMAMNGVLTGVSVAYAQSMYADRRIVITANQDGVTYRRRENMRYTALTIQTPWATATARDWVAKGSNAPILTQLPAMDSAQAGRWARGILMMNNRMAEELTIETSLDTALKALSRVDVTGGTDMSGEWLIDDSEHDLYNKRTRVTMRRVIDTIQ